MIVSTSGSVSPPPPSTLISWGVLGLAGERFTGIFAVFRFETGRKGEFDRARESQDLGLLRRRGLVLSIGDFSIMDPLRLRFVKSPGETRRVGCERVRGSLSIHHLLDIGKHSRLHRVYVQILRQYFTEKT